MSVRELVKLKKEAHESGTRVSHLHDRDYIDEKSSKRRRLEE